MLEHLKIKAAVRGLCNFKVESGSVLFGRLISSAINASFVSDSY